MDAKRVATVLFVSLLGVQPALAQAQQVPPTTKENGWGFDLTGMDARIRPGDNFAMYAFGSWFNEAVIPEGAPAVGLRLVAMRANEQKIGSAIQEAVTHPTTRNRRLIANLYNSYVETSVVERRGEAPLQADLAPIRNARNKSEIAAAMGRSASAFGRSFFAPDIDADRNRPTHHALYLDQSGLGAGSRAIYLDPDNRQAKAVYEAKVLNMLTRASWPNSTQSAAAVVGLETRIAEVSWDRTDSIDIAKINHHMTVRQLEALAPGFPWKAYLSAAGLSQVRTVVVEQKAVFPKIGRIFAETPLSTLKAWSAFSLIDQAAPYLSTTFQGRAPASPETRAMGAMKLADATLVDPVAQEYMALFFPPERKAAVETMVGPIKRALAERIRRNDWMSELTRREALKKLSMLRVSVGYPDHWRNYAGLQLMPGDLYGNMKRIAAFDWTWKVAKLHRPVDRAEWFMAPQTVGAQSNRSRVHITFSAGMLQPPFFDSRNDPAVNYGAMGGVIGHEIGHLFDDQGAKIDASGKLRNWWTPADKVRFDAKTTQLVAMLEDEKLSPDEPVVGRDVLSETMANLLGEQVALDAYHAQLGGKSAPVLDGFTGDQRFFLSYAQTWKAKALPSFWKEMGNQAPPQPSVNIVVRNIDQWYTSFDVKPGDKLYLAPQDRIRIW